MAQNYATKYKNGAARERRIMKKLEQEGWFCIRSAGSHSPIDIIAMISLAEYIKQIDKKGEKEKWEKEDWQKAQEQANKFSSIMTPNQDVVVGYDEELDKLKVIVRFIQSKKTGYLDPQERREKEELEQKLGIKIEVL